METTPQVKIIIPSARATNLTACVTSLCLCEPHLDPADIIVVDDGARTGSERRLPPVTWVTGEQPFVFARNVNIGIRAAGDADVIVLNDDARLTTSYGFTRWAGWLRGWDDLGLCSAAIEGTVCNPNQRPRRFAAFRGESSHLAFVCVYIPRATINAVGLLDERFTGYGFEDFDYCRRVAQAGLRLVIWDGCVVDHSDDRSSTYRVRPDIDRLFEQSREQYLDKWEGSRRTA